MQLKIVSFILFITSILHAQDSSYKKRVLESTEIDFLTSFYSQDGKNAAVSGGTGTEKLTDFTPTIVIAIPLNADDIISLEFGLSAYTSASSSNIDPFDGNKSADAFQASSGASKSDLWMNGKASYTHNSDDRNTIWSGNISFANEFDYSSFGIGGSYTQVFNQKNTELSFNGNIYIDHWRTIYPRELRSFENNGYGLDDRLFLFNTITGNSAYNPTFNAHDKTGRTSLSSGLSLSQILSKSMQGALVFDVVYQNGLLSTPFQRVYFADVQDSFIESFHLADDIEQLPDSRLKYVIGGRLNTYINEMFVVKNFYRYYTDDWGINSHTFEVEVPTKISENFTLYPAYRFYNQTSADYFAAYNTHLSTEKFYTSDYDLSEFNAHQFGLGVLYTDVFLETEFYGFGLKTIGIDFSKYDRNSGLSSYIISLSVGFVFE